MWLPLTAAPAEKKEKAVEKVNATYNELSALVPCHLQGVFFYWSALKND